jgi:hypothetical protein
MPRPVCTEPTCCRYGQSVQGSKSCLCERDEAKTPEEVEEFVLAADRAGVPYLPNRRETHLLAELLRGAAAERAVTDLEARNFEPQGVAA